MRHTVTLRGVACKEVVIEDATDFHDAVKQAHERFGGDRERVELVHLRVESVEVIEPGSGYTGERHASVVSFCEACSQPILDCEPNYTSSEDGECVCGPCSRELASG